jgi:hypothetical protein
MKPSRLLLTEFSVYPQFHQGLKMLPLTVIPAPACHLKK